MLPKVEGNLRRQAVRLVALQGSRRGAKGKTVSMMNGQRDYKVTGDYVDCGANSGLAIISLARQVSPAN
jgi:hypothetical protein